MLANGSGSIDSFLGASLRDESVQWPVAWDEATYGDRVIDRLVYHGIAGVLVEQRIKSLRA